VQSHQPENTVRNSKNEERNNSACVNRGKSSAQIRPAPKAVINAGGTSSTASDVTVGTRVAVLSRSTRRPSLSSRLKRDTEKKALPPLVLFNGLRRRRWLWVNNMSVPTEGTLRRKT